MCMGINNINYNYSSVGRLSIPSISSNHPIPNIKSNIIFNESNYKLPRFVPSFRRPNPPLLSIENDAEFQFCDIETLPSFYFIDNNKNKTEDFAADSKLFLKALKSPLNSKDQSTLLSFVTDANRIINAGFNVNNLEQLIENNPNLAVDVLTVLLKNEDSSSYLKQFLNIPLSLHSVDAMNRLITLSPTPLLINFLPSYILHCIKSCQHLNDRFMQTRLVRIVCVFIASLLRNSIVSVSKLYSEVSTFCIEFQKIKEASDLYKLLKEKKLNE